MGLSIQKKNLRHTLINALLPEIFGFRHGTMCPSNLKLVVAICCKMKFVVFQLKCLMFHDLNILQNILKVLKFVVVVRPIVCAFIFLF